MIKHPCFDQLREQQSGYRVVGDLRNTDHIMEKMCIRDRCDICYFYFNFILSATK